MSEILEKARGLARKKKMREAFDLLHQELRRCDSGKDGFRWRVHLCGMLLDAKKPQLALPHLEAILHDVDGHRLEEWDPKLAMQGLKVAWRGFKAVADPAVPAGDVYKRIAKLDLSEALQLA
jgi:type VI secretion system protein VasJ